jgi:hypothetical protein
MVAEFDPNIYIGFGWRREASQITVAGKTMRR